MPVSNKESMECRYGVHKQCRSVCNCTCHTNNDKSGYLSGDH